ALVWANLHGGFLILFPVLACYVAGVLVSRRPARRTLGPLVLAGAASAAAVLVNPWGPRLVRHLVAFFAARGAVLRHTDEFSPPSLADRAGWTLAVFLALCLAGLGLGVVARLRSAGARPGAGGPPPGAPGLSPGSVLALLLSAAMALRTVRAVEILAVFGGIVLADGVSAWLGPRLGAATRADLDTLRRREAAGGGGLAAAVLLLAAACAAAGWFPPAGFDPGRFPVAMVQRLKAAEVRPRGPVLAPDFWGG